MGVRLRTLGKRLLALLEPFAFYPYCVICQGRLSETERVVCQHCWEVLPAAQPLWLEGEGLRQRYPGCPFAGRFSRWRYSAEAEQIIHLFKYRGRTVLAEEMGRRLSAELGRWESFVRPVLIPVPLHKARRLERGYNQSELLARGLSRNLGWEVVPDCLTRVRYTKSQATLTREERLENVRGAFAVRFPDKVQGMTCVLVDDVVTTGSTAGECAKALLDAGATQVILVTAAAA